jgi:hypothetical protein
MVAAERRSSVYQGKERRPRHLWGWILGPMLVLGGLLLVHCLNLLLQWSLIRRELERKPSFGSPEYTFIGFAPLHRKELAAARLLPNAAPAGRIFASFDLLHPAAFLTWNNGLAEDFFDLGPVMVALPKGASQVTFSPGAVFWLRHGEAAVARNVGGSIVGAFWARALNRKWQRAGKGTLAGSFVLKPAGESSSQRIPYLIYFYLPLAIIVILISTYGSGMAVAFFFYAGMFFLFDFERLFVAVPLGWLFHALGVELPEAWIRISAVSLAVLFLAAAVYGLIRWKNGEMPPSGTWLVLLFVLMPLALFF